MKILQIINRFPWPLKDGGALGYYNFTKGYHDAGVDLTLAVLNTSKHFVELDKLPIEVRELADIHLSYIDNRINPVDALKNLLFSKESYHVVRFISQDFERLLEKLCREKEFDVIVFESVFVAPYLDVVRKYSHAKCILRQYNVEYEIWQSLADIEKNPIKKWYLEVLSRRLKSFEVAQLNKFDGLTCVTQQDANVFNALGCYKPIHIAPVGIDMQRLKPDHSHLEMPSLFHIGSMDWMPNQEAVVWFIENVWQKLTLQFPQLKFYIAGRNMPDYFKKYHGGNIIVLGEVEDAIAFMQSKSIQIVPLFSGSGIRVKILEGMALSKCIVTTPLGVQGIEVENNKELMIVNDADSFIMALSLLINNPQKIIELGSNARDLAKHLYNNKLITKQTLDFYHHV